MDGNRCKSLNEFLYEPGFQNLVQGVHALNTARKSFRDLIEKQWKHFIVRLPDTEKDQLGKLIKCINHHGTKPDFASTLGCGHETCDLLYARLRKLSYVTGDIPVEQDVESSLQETQENFSNTDNGFNFIWDLANCFICVKMQDLKLHGPELDAKTLIKLMKNCRMFAFKDSERIYSQVLENIDKFVYAKDLLISKEGLEVLIDQLLALLRHWQNNCQSCSYGLEDIEKMQHDNADYENFEYKLLVKNVLEIIKSMLNDSESDRDLPTNIKSKDVSSSKELISSLLSQVEVMISALEPNELLELKQKIEYLEVENKTLKMEIADEKSKKETKLKENREIQDKMKQLEAELERQVRLSGILHIFLHDAWTNMHLNK
ncbi:uncharacterized protein LOC132720599 [Ruditapes philippinarum]|uniref:uncharacterized protein LOC132720599 n=1 Tax=Ruditapes philippinarum TaxID=129788 RepID=UPI00295B67D6|nr:uncharacterized protein LOC132720599 [Ruditapes philippinarum]